MSRSNTYARRIVRINIQASAWRLIIDKFILEHIQSCTVTEVHLQTRCEDFTLTVEELEPFIGIMYARGVTGKNDIPLTDLWSKNWGVAFCKQMMFRNHFKEIFRFLPFHEKSSPSKSYESTGLLVFDGMELVC